MKQQIRAELKQGIVRRWYLYILPFALGAVSTAAFLNRYALLEAWTGELRAASFGDCFAYIFRGMQEYIPNQHQPFEVPVLFLLINILLAVLIGGYAAGELHGTGLNKLVRCRRRSDWWICKCIWNVISVLGYYAALIAGAVTAAFIVSVKPDGAAFFLGIAPHKEVVVKLLFCENPDKLNEKMLCCMVFVLPVLTSMAVSLFQMTIEFILQPWVSFMVLMANCVFSAFFLKGCWLGNYMMLYRMKPVNANGVDWQTGILINLLVIAAIQKRVGEDEIRETLEKIGLDPDDKRTYRKYSLGMKQRLGIAAAVMENPDIVILDEPINALDESGAKQVRTILKEQKERGAVCIIACHDSEELNFLSDEIIEIAEGRIVPQASQSCH